MPGEFFNLSQECLANGTVNDYKELLKDDNPVVRVMGLVLLAQADPEEYSIIAKDYQDDKTVVETQRGCVIGPATVGNIARWLEKNPYYFGREGGQLPDQQ